MDERSATVAALRARLERGDLSGSLVFDGHSWPDPSLLIRIMLADAEHYGDLEPAYRRRPGVAARERALTEDLARLRDLLGG